MAKEVTVELKQIKVNEATITIVGDTDLVLNKMSDPVTRALTDQRKNKGKGTAKPNEWEIIMTAMHWRDGKPTDFSEEGLKRALVENAPCISAFGLKKSFGDAVVRNAIDKAATKLMASVNILAPGNLVPIKFAEHHIDEKLMSPKRGAPVLARLNRFTGWSTDIKISYVENAYSLDQILEIINLAGFGIGIGSGRSSGYGRYHVEAIS